MMPIFPSLHSSHAEWQWPRGGVILLVMVCAAAVLSCTSAPNSPSFQPSPTAAPYTQSNFAEYVQETTEWIRKNRVFLTDQHELEVRLNSPFEQKPTAESDGKKGILLVHGLGASPGYFEEMAQELAGHGWLVRVILLPGHGARPADLLETEYEDWKNIISHHAALLSGEVDEMWLGGFSLGANLVAIHALSPETVAGDKVSGLLLFSPAFYPKRQRLLRFSPLISFLWDWVDIDEEENILSFQSLSTNASSLYYQSMKEFQTLFNQKSFDKPAMIAMSRHDSIMDPHATLNAFQAGFSHPDSRFIWYGPMAETEDPRIRSFSTYLPDLRISTFSHMNGLFSPDHFYFGKNGRHIMWDNGQEDIPRPSDPSKLWFSAWGYQEKDKYHARLTWNPYFDELMDFIIQITSRQITSRQPVTR